ncbi:Mitogen-activated protein kinase kinase kinase [Bertholletia excelsa]
MSTTERSTVKGEGKVKTKQEDEVNACKQGGDGAAWLRGSMIGEGSFGSVYVATSKKHGCFPAVMAVKSAEVSDSGSLQKERETLSSIGRCPYVIQCFGEETTMGYNGHMIYNLLLEYCPGGTLADLIKKSGGRGLPEHEVRHYTRSILRGLSHIHNCGFVHCDLKPENLLLVPNTRGNGTKFTVKIGDFGLSKKVTTKNRKRKLDIYWGGTPMYLSPEVVAEGIQGAPSDIWALGCIVLEMMTGRPPWYGKQDLDPEALLDYIGEGKEMPSIPDKVSMEGKVFLKGCFAKKTMFRLTAEMLLHHSFVEGLAEDDEEPVEMDHKVLLADAVSLPLLLSTTNNECSYSSFSDDSSLMSVAEFSLSSWSEDEEEIDSLLPKNGFL